MCTYVCMYVRGSQGLIETPSKTVFPDVFPLGPVDRESSKIHHTPRNISRLLFESDFLCILFSVLLLLNDSGSTPVEGRRWSRGLGVLSFHTGDDRGSNRSGSRFFTVSSRIVMYRLLLVGLFNSLFVTFFP